MDAHVICVNDSVEHVVIGTRAEAEAKLEELRAADFERDPWRSQPLGRETRETAYRRRCRWYVKTVDVTGAE